MLAPVRNISVLRRQGSSLANHNTVEKVDGPEAGLGLEQSISGASWDRGCRHPGKARAASGIVTR